MFDTPVIQKYKYLGQILTYRSMQVVRTNTNEVSEVI